MPISWSRWGETLGVFTIALLPACGSDDGGGAGETTPTDAAVQDARAADAGPEQDATAADASLADQAAAFCRDLARAKCEWAFACADLSPGDRIAVLALPGDDVDACVRGASGVCVADAADRAERGTLTLDPVEIDDCLQGATRAPCVAAPAADWVSDWRENIYDRCRGVLGGTVEDDAACVKSKDCVTAGAICTDDACREPTVADLQLECEATGRSEGLPNADPACPGRFCINVGRNDAGKTGICSVDCSETRGACPAGTQCLHISSGSTQYFYCTVPCERDAQCDNGFTCEPVDPLMPDTKHCWAK